MGEIGDLYATFREATRPRALARTARGLARLGLAWARPPSRVELGVVQWRLMQPDNEARWRGAGDNFDAVGGRKIAHGRSAGSIARSMTSIRALRAFCLPELVALGPRGPASFLEFGACCGTTSLTVLEHFPECRILAFEPMRERTQVYEELRRLVPIDGRITWIEDILEHHLDGVRAMFPDGCPRSTWTPITSTPTTSGTSRACSSSRLCCHARVCSSATTRCIAVHGVR